MCSFASEKLQRNRAFHSHVLDQLLPRAAAALTSPVAQHSDESLREKRLGRLGEEKSAGYGQFFIGSQATGPQQTHRVGCSQRFGVVAELLAIEGIKDGARWTSLKACLALVVEKLLPLREAQSPGLVTHSQEHFITLIRMHGWAGIDLEDE